MMNASIRIKNANLSTGQLSISKTIAKSYFNGDLSGIIVFDEEYNYIEEYSSQELAVLMGNLVPRPTKDGKKVSFYLAKRK